MYSGALRPSSHRMAFGLLGVCLASLAGVVLGGAPSRVIVVGGSSGMGKALAKAIVARSGSVLLVSRSMEKLVAAQADILGHSAADAAAVEIEALDCSDEAAVAAFAAQKLTAGSFDGLVVSAAGAAPHGDIETLATESVVGLFESKFWTAYYACKHFGPMLADGGAVALVSGVLNRRPGLNCAPLASVNGALEGLTRSLALDWGPRLRVNCLSPGFCDTERFDRMEPARKVRPKSSDVCESSHVCTATADDE